MPNIFDGLAKASDQDILEQVALLQAINMTNVCKPYGIKLQRGAVGLVNKVGGFFNKDPELKKAENRELWDYIEEKREEIKGLSRSELDRLMVSTLSSKIKSKKDNNTPDGISVRVIEEAAELLKIPKDLTPAQKADSVGYIGSIMKAIRKEGGG